MTIDQHRFCVIGPGRLGSTVLAGLLEAKLTVTAVGVHADDDTSLFDFVPHVRVRDAALEADAWWLAVPDDELTVAGRLAEALPAMRRPGAPQSLAIHSSGLGSVRLLKPLYEQGVRVLCLHPLQTFAGEPDAWGCCRASPARSPRSRNGTCSSARSSPAASACARFAWPTRRRRSTTSPPLSAATCWWRSKSEAKRLMDEATGEARGLDHLSALLETTMKNLLQSGEPALALTGPVARGDIGTVRAHLRLLDRESPRLAGTYRALSLEALTLAAPRLDDDQVADAARTARGRRTRRRSRGPDGPPPVERSHWAGGQP